MIAKKRVLVVDDNPINLSILDEMLSDDYRLAFALSGTEAIREAVRFQPAVILLDVMMPGMDGLETCRQIRQTAGLSNPVIIMVSAKAMPSEQAAGMRAGADDYITKPFDSVELLGLLRNYLHLTPDVNGNECQDADEKAEASMSKRLRRFLCYTNDEQSYCNESDDE